MILIPKVYQEGRGRQALNVFKHTEGCLQKYISSIIDNQKMLSPDLSFVRQLEALDVRKPL